MKLQKRLAGQILGCSPKRVHFNPDRLEDIRKAITAFDIRRLIRQGVVSKVQAQGVSRVRAKARQAQKRKGRHYGSGSRKGKVTARQNPKSKWVSGVRAQREFIKDVRDKEMIGQKTFADLYRKVKGGFFRSVKHIKIYMNEQRLFKETAGAVRKDGNK
ncbi:50S ribosomal protein L19e [Candidatus Woesearchaeota archaeon]|nr:MAG: 50S ribosomal protein L19e [Candidatus Woesearchaeota archaeon]